MCNQEDLFTLATSGGMTLLSEVLQKILSEEVLDVPCMCMQTQKDLGLGRNIPYDLLSSLIHGPVPVSMVWKWELCIFVAVQVSSTLPVA